MTNELQICSKCHQAKDQVRDFYMCAGKWRSECKACTIKRNARYQKRVKAWQHRFIDDDARREYMRDYYKKNKERFEKYRAEFRERYPDYYINYFRDKKKKK